LFAAWEEGEFNWGKPFKAPLDDEHPVNEAQGPLHRYRSIRVAELSKDGRVLPIPFPMPALRVPHQEGPKAGQRDRQMGVFYERPITFVDRSNRLWIFYRHYSYPEMALPGKPTSHVETGWMLYGRCLHGSRWSELVGMEPRQRDGMQRLAIAGDGERLFAAWSTGRTSRPRAGTEPERRGIAVTTIGFNEIPLAGDEVADLSVPEAPARSKGAGRREPDFLAENVEGNNYHLVMGDLHRHTDFSLCRAYFDGSQDDAYRYAIEAAELDFFAVTDHARDIDNANVDSQIWWRSIKEVTRHRLRRSFHPFFAYERSHGDTDHNVISLKNEMLWSHLPPLADFWERIDPDTFTIPHSPIRPTRAFADHDDVKRPLLELYQGCRNQAMTEEAHQGLAKGFHMGFVASSDHMSTHASFACVWTPENLAVPIFRSLQARRTYAATAKIRLVFRTGGHWMGEVVSASSMPTFHVSVDGTAPIDHVDIIRNGEKVETFVNPGPGPQMKFDFRGQGPFEPRQYYYVHVVQKDGEQAWSSPIWVEGKPPVR